MTNTKSTDIRIRDVQIEFESHEYRSPIKFGGNVVRDVVLLNVQLSVENRTGQVATGQGSMPLGNVWAFPPIRVSPSESLAAMRELAHHEADITRDFDQCAHPLDLSLQLESKFLEAAQQLGQSVNLAEPVPKLAALVVSSPFDAALFDGFGKAAGFHAFHGLSSDYMAHDLSYYLNRDFKGQYLDQYVADEPKSEIPLYHLVGALDPLTEEDDFEPVGDGLPETLSDWIRRDGLTHLKIKLNGDDLQWDVSRIVSVDAVASQADQENQVRVSSVPSVGQREWVYSLDFNERAPNVEYLIECLEKVKEQSSRAFERVAYVEQPTSRDLKAHPENKMHRAAAIKPVVIDESLVDFESLMLAREQGYTGVALKACKGQGQSLLMAAAAQHYGMFLCVQDLTCPGRSFVHSVGLAAWIGPVTAIEGNGRQYCPIANATWEQSHPSIFVVEQGRVKTGDLDKPGLGIID